MSDLQAAAAALSIPEELVQRSAAARAAASGSSVDEVLAAWAGGAPAPAAAEPEPAPAEETEAQEETPAQEETTSEPTPAPASQPAATAPAPSEQPVLVAAGPVEPPVLTGRTEHPLAIMFGALTLLTVALLVGFLAPAIPAEGNGVYTSVVPLTQEALDGRDLYRSEGCAACHTQMVRPIVADVGLGPVTVSDTNQILGLRRYGPDLAHIGSRVDSQSALLTLLTASSDHPSYAGLSDADLDSLTAYLFQSK